MFTKIFRKINFLGALKTPLLRVLIIQIGNYTYLNFPKLHFFPICRSNIATIEAWKTTLTLLVRNKRAEISYLKKMEEAWSTRYFQDINMDMVFLYLKMVFLRNVEASKTNRIETNRDMNKGQKL